MTTDDVIKVQPKSEVAYDVRQAGNSHLQFQLEMDRPHILIVSDLKNTNNSSVMKLGADIRAGSEKTQAGYNFTIFC